MLKNRSGLLLLSALLATGCASNPSASSTRFALECRAAPVAEMVMDEKTEKEEIV